MRLPFRGRELGGRCVSNRMVEVKSEEYGLGRDEPWAMSSRLSPSATSKVWL